MSMRVWKAAAIKMGLVSMLAPVALLAQNSDLALLAGFRPCGDCRAGTVATGSQYTYGYQVLSTAAGDFYVEFPLVSDPNPVGNVAYLFAPGLRFRLPTHSRVAFYSSLGVGLASFGGTADAGRTTSGAVDFGGGVDFRFTRVLSLRVDVRDFVTRPRLGGTDGRNHAAYFLGVAFHF